MHPNPTRRALARPGRRGARTLVAAAAAAATALLGLLPAAAASAAPIDAFTSVTIEAPDPANPSAPLTVGQRFRVDAAWSLPAGAQPGDTLTLTFPSPVRGYSSSFSLDDSTGAKVGDCTVTNTTISCTLGDYVATHTDIAGSLYFYASAAETSTGDLLFQTSAGTTIHVAVPGGGIEEGTGGGGWDPPTTLIKGGWQNDDGTTGWVVYLPGDLLTHDGQDVTVTDTYDPRLTLDRSSLSIVRIPISGWNDGDWGAAAVDLAAGDYTFAPGASSFELTVHDADPDSIYAVLYTLTVPAGTPDGTHFENTVSGQDTGSAEAAVDYVAAGGNASGDALRSIAVTKRIAGDGTAPSGTFPITVVCTRDGAAVAGYPATADIAADQTHTFTDIPAGASCTVTETDSRGAASVSYSPSGAIDVVAGTGSIPVTVTNTYAAEVVVPTPTPTPTPPVTPAPGPTVPSADGGSSTPALAHTGSDNGPAVAIAATAAALAVIAGATLALMRGARRRRS